MLNRGPGTGDRPSGPERDAEVMQPEEGAVNHPAVSSRKELTSETDAARWRLKLWD